MKGNERIEKFLELQNKNINIDDIAKEIGITTRTLKSFLTKNGYKLENGKYVPKEIDAVNQIAFTETYAEENKTTKRTTKKSTEPKIIETKSTEIKSKTNTNSKTKSKVTPKETKTITQDNKKTNKIETKGTNATNKKTTTSVKTRSTTKTTPKSNTRTSNKQVEKTAQAQKTTKVNNAKPKKDRKINLTQEDMDKLCEVYDWYLEVKDNKNMKPKKTVSKKDVNIEEKNLKDLKSASIRVDKNTWEDFERLCSNSEFTKQEIITQALKDFMKEYKHLL